MSCWYFSVVLVPKSFTFTLDLHINNLSIMRLTLVFDLYTRRYTYNTQTHTKMLMIYD